ncbi:MAG TPA: hypothetical protein PK798_12280 [Flavobacteriales bacterium]|nr:hypothetical protein [Flavobacteriales bacterium]
MRHILFLFISIVLVCANNSLVAQIPEKIYGKNTVLKSNEYYLQQIPLWKNEIDMNPKNADAWFNYYRANRNAYIKGEEDNSQKSKGISRFDRLKNIVDEMEKQVPNSYEYNFVKWLNGNNDLNLFPYLEKAHNLSPKSSEPIMSLIFYYEIKGDYVKRDEKIEAFYAIGDYSPGLLNYSYNLLSALETDAIVFTEGDKDTEAILLLTKGKKYRPDVKMLNVNLLLIKEYRERIFTELEIPQLDFEPIANEENYEKFQQLIIKRVIENKKARPVYAAVTLSEPYRNRINNDLYLTGLTYLYSTKKIDNISLLVQNVEQVFLLDYLKEYFSINDISVGNVNSMNGNYLYSFATLSHHYYSIGNTVKADYYKKLALKVATEGEILNKYKTYFTE